MTQRTKKTRVKGFQVVEDQCIWMKAGIVNFRLCDNVYDCMTCPFDKAMQRTARQSPAKEMESLQGGFAGGPGWEHNLKHMYTWTNTPCRHVLTGRVDAPKTCTRSYECYHCEYDQMLDKEDMALPFARPACSKASGYLLADGYYYHMGHTWARFEHGGRVRIGFDDFLVRLFGTPTQIGLPPLGAELKKDHAGILFSRADQEAAAFSPITGSVVAVNTKASDTPEIVHKDPYHDGWLCILEPDSPKKTGAGLFYGKDSLEWTDRESQKLLGLIAPEYHNLAATGGEPIDDVFARFPEIGWEVLAKTFLRSQKR